MSKLKQLIAATLAFLPQITQPTQATKQAAKTRMTQHDVDRLDAAERKRERKAAKRRKDNPSIN